MSRFDCIRILLFIASFFFAVSQGTKLHKSSSKFSWDDARLYCRFSGNGDLFSPTNKERFKMGAKVCGRASCWIGVHRATKTSPLFVTAYYDTYYLLWDCGQPDNWKKSEACVALKASGQASDLQCNQMHHALCDSNHQ